MSRALLALGGLVLLVLAYFVGRLHGDADGSAAETPPLDAAAVDAKLAGVRAEIAMLREGVEHGFEESRRRTTATPTVPAPETRDSSASAEDSRAASDVEKPAEIASMLRDLKSEIEAVKARLELVPIDLAKLQGRRPDVDTAAVLRFVDAHRGDEPKTRAALLSKSLADVIEEFGSPTRVVEEQTKAGVPAVPWNSSWAWSFGDGRRHIWVGVLNGRIVGGGIYDP